MRDAAFHRLYSCLMAKQNEYIIPQHLSTAGLRKLIGRAHMTAEHASHSMREISIETKI
jgi:hypothetical protein